jgi:hypothetical protein
LSWIYTVGKTHLGEYGRVASKNSKTEDRQYFLVNEWHMRNWFRYVGLEVRKVNFIGNTCPYIFKRFIVSIVSKILQNTIFWRMSYYRIKIIGTKSLETGD